MSTKERILVVVLDGATFDILNPMLEKNELPNLSKIIEKGIKGSLTSTFPPVTPVAWASLITGKNPGKHGIMDFVTPQKESYHRTIVNASNVKSKTLWYILSKANKRLGILHAPLLTNPPENVNGFIVSGHPFSPEASTYPPELKKEILEKIPGYKRLFTDIRLKKYIPGTEDLFLASIYYALGKVAEVTFYLMEKYEWDFFITHFFFGDTVQHVFWKYLDPEHPLYDENEAKKYGKTINNYYREIDAIIGKILAKINKDTTVVVISDHGFGPLYKEVYINQWLKKIGLLELKERPKVKARKIFDNFGLTREHILNLAEKNSLVGFLLRVVPPKLIQVVFKKLSANANYTAEDVDYSQTKAYSYGDLGQIFINLKGRDPEGIVKSEEYEKVRNYIINELYKLKDPESGTQIVDQVFKREEIYHGHQLNKAADLLFVMKDMSYITPFSINIESQFTSKKGSLTRTSRLVTGWHRMDGILIISGPQIKKNSIIENARIIDLAPTILHINNIPIPADMDGRVLLEIFRPKSQLANKKILYQNPKEPQKGEHYTTEKEKKAILESLRALGYLK